jgi:radical SAM protein with 4Fe4S-binding SPASM domain
MAALPWSRSEPFGAWVRLDDATLVAVDHGLASRLGVPMTAAPAPLACPFVVRPLEVHVAVTARCPVGCDGCYLDARADGQQPSLDHLKARLDAARRVGASTVALGGGEPLMRRDLAELAGYARSLGLVPVMTTSGVGLTDERARELAAFAQINVSHDGVGAAYAAVRGFEGVAIAERAIAALARAQIPVGVNVVLTRASWGVLERTVARVAELGAGEVQLLRYKPAGRAAGSGYAERRLSPAQVAGLWPTIERIVRAGRVRVRIDCAMVPLLSPALIELPDAERRLAALGVFGCEAGRHLGALTVEGRTAPCSFAASTADPAEPLDEAWANAADLESFRSYHANVGEPCASCSLRAVCRGGCQVVSMHAHGRFAPDPECPRVIDHEARLARGAR